MKHRAVFRFLRPRRLRPDYAHFGFKSARLAGPCHGRYGVFTPVALKGSRIRIFSDCTEANSIAAVDKLVRLNRDLIQLLRNFVSFRDFYGRQDKAIFQAGTLYLDRRSCDLCLSVEDPGKHASMAGLAGTYLAYCDCVRKSTCEKRQIVAAFTNGDSDNLMVDRNGIWSIRLPRRKALGQRSLLFWSSSGWLPNFSIRRVRSTSGPATAQSSSQPTASQQRPNSVPTASQRRSPTRWRSRKLPSGGTANPPASPGLVFGLAKTRPAMK